MLYGEKMKEILTKLGVDVSKLNDNLYSTLLNAIYDNCGDSSTPSTTNTVKALLDYTKSCRNMLSGNNNITDLTGYLKYDDTSNVTSMKHMFSECNALTSIPQLDTNKVTDMSYMFSWCPKLTSIPLLNTSNVTDMSSMFYGCLILTTIPQLNTSKVTNIASMFSGCSSLTSIPLLNTNKVTDMRYVFSGCSKLTEIHMTGMRVSFDISASTLFTREALVEILNNLATVTSNQTLTMGATNLAKLTNEDKAIATNKGWTLA